MIRASLLSLVALINVSCLAQIQRESERNAQRNFEENDRACLATASPEACATAGSAYERGQYGAPMDPRAAADRYLRGCHAPNPARTCPSARFLADKVVSFDPALGVRLVRATCDAGDLDGCMDLARWYDSGKGGLPKDKHYVRTLYWHVCRMAQRLGDASSYSDHATALSGCRYLALAALFDTPPDKVLAAKLGIVIAELEMESNEALWAMEDRSAKQQRESEEELARLREEARLAEQERASRPDTFSQILGALSTGLSMAQQTSIAQRSRPRTVAASAPIAQAGQHKTHHYTPPPRVEVKSVARAPKPYHVVPTPAPPTPQAPQCIRYRQQGCTLTTDCCDAATSGVICGAGSDGINRCCSKSGTLANSEMVYCCNGTFMPAGGSVYDLRCK
jgi:hypothetical protein